MTEQTETTERTERISPKINPVPCVPLFPSVPCSLFSCFQLLKSAAAGDETALAESLYDEESTEREADRNYWKPLRAELEKLRHERE